MIDLYSALLVQGLQRPANDLQHPFGCTAPRLLPWLQRAGRRVGYPDLPEPDLNRNLPVRGLRDGS